MSFKIEKLMWRQIPAGYYVLGGLRWFEVLSNISTGGGKQTVRLRHENREGTFTYPSDDVVSAKPGPRVDQIARAIQAFSDPFEVTILEDKPPWD